ncbi:MULTISPECIES: [FeFe] hydrogenase, group A [Clostridium]|uniref:Hydrogenase, Fe-only n=1 Tax=Clostridium saccharoperbutylacetonicum N1-4(HMT) TaxID=931276 RepID=M1MHB8_9CLOT|nr:MULTISPECIES: [FeFe] hydrogenase, group A [Clostridium]AGF57299.1 hydrogenase, Fe-only [Clostridium saccharoperbutylacetonicum N1-4(HMT)]AQR95994.1 NADP-reducing hydrogenase subunit HndC [Clostridium saccharoperbutylacetonicum]NRT61938.1 iron-only hydrogenase group A [Clostridium saccharoperbutylacetonicum]NSB25267.1 iron-only hydrogenase group A [Clostridium saccharoperbutylacetonicum]NSB31861.1 iron-only hydrogenase group A [Clostridium saccharoperbutylacetonicum]
MVNNNTSFIQSSLGSVFSVFSEEELKQLKDGRKIAICGKVNKPGIIEVPEGATLNDIIELCGGLINKSGFKAAQIGLPFGGFLTEDSLNKEFDFNLFYENIAKTIIVLSQEDCIIQFEKFYIRYLLAKIKDGSYKNYEIVKEDITEMYNVLNRISKGVSNMRELYTLRNLAITVKTKMNQKHNIMEEIIDKFYEEIEEHIEEKKCPTSQCSHLIKLKITKKCIGCGACKRACPVDCIDGELKKQHVIDDNRCTHCGACVSACPVDAIFTGDNTLLFLRNLATPNKVVITQMAPAVRVAIGEAFGFEPGENVEKKLAAGLRKLGVDYVFDTSWGADLTIMEEAAELQERLEKHLAGDENVKLPILTSCCPSWIKFIEQNYGDMLEVPSSAKSPMEMFGIVAKEIWAKEKGLKREEISSVAIMPCIAKKYEASRPEFSVNLDSDVNYVITTRELIKIFQDSGIDLRTLEDEEIDTVMGEYTGAGIIFGRTGGVIEAAVRTAMENMTGERVDNIEFEGLRGWDGFRVCEIEVKDIKLRIGVAHGLREAAKMLDKVRSGEEFFHAIEIMACVGGCIGGGGQPKIRKNKDEVLQKRAEGLNNIDRAKTLRRSNENPEVLAIYEKYLGHPLSNKAHELLHTTYFPRAKKNNE